MATVVACGADTSGSAAAASANVEVRPNNALTVPSGNVSFAATVTGAALTTVTWSIQEAGCGTISSSGVYTAPTTDATCHVVATLASYGVTSAPATVNVANSALCANEPMRSTGAVHYYCDCGSGADPACVPGSDTNSGLAPSSPKQTGSKTMFKAMAAGDTVALCRGGAFTWDGSNTNNPNCRAGSTCDVRDYTPSAHPEWANDQTKRPIINADRVLYLGSGYQGFRLFNLEVRSPSQSQGAVMTQGATDGDICNVKFNDCWIGVYLGGGPRWTVRQGQFALIGRLATSASHAILGGCTDCAIDGNYFAPDSYGTNGYYDHNIYLNNWNVQRMRVTNNEIHACPSTRPASTGTVQLVVHGSYDDLLIENNLLQCDNPSLSGGSDYGIGTGHGSYTYDGNNARYARTIIRRNRVVDHPGIGIVVNQSPDSVIEDNVVIMPTNAKYAVGIASGEDGPRAGTGDAVNNATTARNNTIYYRSGSNSVGVRIGNEGTGHNVTNNAVLYAGGSGNSCFAFNLAATAYSMLSNNACSAAWGTGYDVNRVLLAASAFQNATGGDFTPVLGSPLVNAGTAATTCTVAGAAGQPCYSPTAVGNTAWSMSDTGKARDAQPDIGAYER